MDNEQTKSVRLYALLTEEQLKTIKIAAIREGVSMEQVVTAFILTGMHAALTLEERETTKNDA